LNAQEKKALNRALISKENWKTKARSRQKMMRLQQLKIRDLERSRAFWKEKSVVKTDAANHKVKKEKDSLPSSKKSITTVKKK